MAIKLMDSTLVDFTRTGNDGIFNLKKLPIDTYQVVISHPQFSDMGFFIFGDTKNLTYDFGKIILLPKNVSLDEVTIFAFKDPIYYKGDTLIYTADSFKTRANATVEDLLKKLPGIKVGLDGKITSQGKKVDKVLVDGDEFFGSDPTIATKNLNANTIESIQVYDKKSDDVANNSTGEETQKIMNLKLKDDAKNGYFGKISGASDFKKFYEGEALANYFKKKLKVSVFGLASNTPRSSFGWDDVYKFGLNNEMNFTEDEDGNGFSYINMNNNEGIPSTLKTGFYYSDRISKKTKLGINYSYNNNQLASTTTTTDQYFLTDTTYSTNNQTTTKTKTEKHSINFNIEQKIDSLTDLYITSKVSLSNSNFKSINETNFVNELNTLTRNTDIKNTSTNNSQDVTNNFFLIKRTKKKDRIFKLTYNQNFNNTNEEAFLLTTNSNFDSLSTLNLNNINQKKVNSSKSNNHFAGIVYTEPLTAKTKIELSYDYLFHENKQDKKSVNNIGGEYTELDSNFTNNFNNLKQINRAGLKFIYEIKKVYFTIGSKARNVNVKNTNLITQQIINQNFNNILPFSTIRYKFSENKQASFSYTSNSKNPSINQLQPIPDNTNANFIIIGNPNLLPTFSHQLNLNFNSWKPISNKYTWVGLSYNNNANDFVNRSYFDSIGRSITQTVNLKNAGYSYSGYFGTSFPVFKKLLTIEPSTNANYNNSKNFINNLQNTTNIISIETALQISFDKENIGGSIGASNTYNRTSSTLNNQSNKPFQSQNFTGNINVKLPKKISVETTANYNLNSNRTDGYNINFLVWNATLNKTFLKNENLIIGIHAFDILNQNISVARNINANVITDTKTNIISRYFLLKATFKFNSNKIKDDEDEF